jgi:hypothetical protein
MLGPVGPFLSSILRNKNNYTTYRHTMIEKKYLRSPWAQLISKSPVRFGEIYENNRKLRKGVTSWTSMLTPNFYFWSR